LIADLKNLYPNRDQANEASMVHLYGAMVEAIVNVVRHAYPIDSVDGPPDLRRWWMTGAVDRAARWTTAVVYDQGITIPVSLPNWQHFAGWRHRILSAIGAVPDTSDTRSDGQAIAAAVEESASSTGEQHRGHGLAQMRNFVDQCQDGYLRIMSRCGEVIFRPKKKPEIRSYDVSVGGTLVEWNVLI
jgi:anti-sigma regulatory factor (Ser/Thr protein kinase)